MSYSVTFRKVYLSGPSAGVDVYDGYSGYPTREDAERRAESLRCTLCRDMRAGELFKYIDVQVEVEPCR